MSHTFFHFSSDLVWQYVIRQLGSSYKQGNFCSQSKHSSWEWRRDAIYTGKILSFRNDTYLLCSSCFYKSKQIAQIKENSSLYIISVCWSRKKNCFLPLGLWKKSKKKKKDYAGNILAIILDEWIIDLSGF